jgi:hypothetical protein
MLNNRAIKGCMADIGRATDVIKAIIEQEADNIKPNNKTILEYALDRIINNADSIVKRLDDQ